MEDCVWKNGIETIKKVYQALLLAKERLSDVVYGSEDQWSEYKRKRRHDEIKNTHSFVS